MLQTPAQRRKRGMVDPDVQVFDSVIDAVHTALLVLQEDGARPCELFLKRTGLISDGQFRQAVQALLNAIPRTQVKGKWVRVEAELLERLRQHFFTDLTAPKEEAPPELPQQLGLFDQAVGGEEETLDEEGAEDEEPDE